MVAEDIEASGLRGKMRALHEKLCSACVDVPTDMSAVVTVAEQSLHLKH